jgi:3-deoxy-D-arabino-heptulosonate 7-phosphate (DAHP) synthase class II
MRRVGSLVLYYIGDTIYWLMERTASVDDQHTRLLYRMYNWLMIKSSDLDANNEVWDTNK